MDHKSRKNVQNLVDTAFANLSTMTATGLAAVPLGRALEALSAARQLLTRMEKEAPETEEEP